MIRNATKEDASRIAEILIFSKRTAYRSIFKNDKVSFGEMQVLPLALEYINTPSLIGNFYVYDDEFVQGMIEISTDMDVPEISQLYVDPFFQRCRIGSALLDYAENYIHNKGFSYLSLWVLKKNTTTRAFYEKNGFVVTSEKNRKMAQQKIL